MRNDPWLDPLLAQICARAGDKPVLELGCGSGIDSVVLAGAGCRVVGVDRSESALSEARLRVVPTGTFHCQDVRSQFPLGPRSTGVVVASLSIHYFRGSKLRLLSSASETFWHPAVYSCAVSIRSMTETTVRSACRRSRTTTIWSTANQSASSVEPTLKRCSPRVGRFTRWSKRSFTDMQRPKVVWQAVLDAAA